VLMPQVGSHWSEKARDDMTERDWRIFREDHNIAYRGAALDKSTLPIRNWQEAGLPKTLVKVHPCLAGKSLPCTAPAVQHDLEPTRCQLNMDSASVKLLLCNTSDACVSPLQAVDALGYTKPSPIQMAAIPLGMQFRDVIGIAETVYPLIKLT
jgi:ATP-dependent RNA helicase DDX23/PRP28